MRYDFAPLEGITTALYRRVHRVHFPSLDRYYTPFYVPSEKGLAPKELRPLSAERESGLPLVVQLLCKNPSDFLRSAAQLRDCGFAEINLNLGCPSGTVTAKGRGAGALRDLAQLRALLDEIFTHSPLPVSIKTRIGFAHEAEWEALYALFASYPISELCIHPRLRSDHYRGKPRMHIWDLALKQQSSPLLYSGDLFTAPQIHDFAARYPTARGVLLGRGLIANPGLHEQVCTGRPLSLAKLQAFHEELYAAYRGLLPGPRPLLHKMKELWHYMICLFAAHDKAAKRLRKAQTLPELEGAIAAIFRELDFAPQHGFCPPDGP